MQKFNKKQIALAVSATLLAGSALAAATAPVARTAKPVLITAATTVDNLYKTTGMTGSVTIQVAFTAAEDTSAAAGDYQVITAGADGLLVNTGTVAAPAEDDIQIYVDDAAKTKLTIGPNSFTANLSTAAQATASIAVAAPDANGAFRINAGKLEYTADNTVSSIVWTPVKVVLNAATTAANRITATDSVGPATAPIATVAGQDVYTTVVPSLKSVKTRATAGLVDGITFETYSPLAGFANDDVEVNTVSTGDVNKAAAVTTGYTAQAKAGAANTYEVFFGTPATIDWTTGDATADAAAYAYDTFNTGITGGDLPFSVAVTANASNQTTFSEIFVAADGTNAKFSGGLNTAAATDGAAPVLQGAEYQSAAGALTLTFSEPVRAIANVWANADDLREILENVKLNGVTLAADYQIREAGVWVDTPTGGRTLVINNLGEDRTDVEGKTISLTSGLSLVEDAATPTADTAGLRTATGTGAAALDNTFSGSFVATLNNTVAFNDSSARAFYAAGDLTKIDYIDVDFNKTLSVKAGKSLDKTLKVTFRTINPLTYGDDTTGRSFDWYPTGSEITVTGDTIRLTLPTDLLRANLDDGSFITQSTVTYTAGTDKALEAAINSTTKVDVASATENVIMPLMASAANQGLYTMDVKATLTGAQAGSKTIGYLAKWVDKATADVVSMDIVSGKVTLPGDKWASDVVLALDGGVGALETEINKQLKEAKPAAVTGWVVVSRSNDAVKGGSNAGTDGYQDSTENFLVATAKLYGTAAAAAAAASNGQAEKTAFEVAIDPKTGKISGRLTGQLVLKNLNTNANERGLVFIKPDGKLSNYAGDAAQSQALVDGTGKARFLIGADPKADLKGAGDIFKDAFVLVVHESQDADGNSTYALVTSAEPSMSNFLPFSANIVAGNDAVGSLNLTLANNVKRRLPGTSSWQLIGAGNLDRKAGAAAAINMPRLLVGLSGNQPYSFWTNDGEVKDMALTMLGNKAGVAVEAKDKDTVTVADKANTKANAFAFAVADDQGDSGHLFFATKAAEAPALPVGWSLIAQPAAAATSSLTDATMVLTGNADFNVGIGGSWVTGDAAKDLSAGQPIFIYQKKAVAGK